MFGIVTKMEVQVVEPYSKDKRVVGTTVTVQHDVSSNDKGSTVNSTVFFPANSNLPTIGQHVSIALSMADETVPE